MNKIFLQMQLAQIGFGLKPTLGESRASESFIVDGCLDC